MLSVYSKHQQRANALHKATPSISQVNAFKDAHHPVNQHVTNVRLLNKWDEEHLYPSKARKAMRIKQRVSCYLEQSSLDKMKYQALISHKIAANKHCQMNKLRDISVLLQESSKANQTQPNHFGPIESSKDTSTRIVTSKEKKVSIDDENSIGAEQNKFLLKSKKQLEKIYHNEIISIINELNKKKEVIAMLQNEQSAIHKQIEEKKQRYMECKDTVSIIEKEHLNGDNQHGIFKLIQKQKLQKLTSQMSEIEKEYLISTALNSQRLKQISNELSELKYEITSLTEFKRDNVKCLIDYYFDILSKGVDVREVGLVWVIIRLFELNVRLSVDHFPKFLDYVSVHFLMEYSDKVILVRKLKVLIETIKAKYQRDTGVNDGLEMKSSETEPTVEEIGSKGVSLQFPSNQSEAERIDTLKAQIVKAMGNETSSIGGNRQSQSFTLTYLRSMRKSQLGGMFNTNGLHHILEDLSQLRNHIVKIENEIKEMKSSYLKYFKCKYEPMKMKGLSECARYDLMFNALFGNHTLI